MTHVGIMTMQRIRNYGSTLQAYGLRRLIERADPNATVSYVDFAPGPPLVPDVHHTAPVSRAVHKLREYATVGAPFADRVRFINHKRSYNRYLGLAGIPDTPVLSGALDVQVIGSDEVFNCVQSNTNVGYSRDLFGHGTPASTRLISYAASFGNTTLDKIDSYGIRTDLAEDLRRFEALSVRDRNSAEIVQALTGRTAEVHVDPVLAYDFMGLEPRIPSARQIAEPYIAVYAYAGRLDRRENDAIRRYARHRGVRVLSFGGVHASADRFVDCDPFRLLAYIRDAEAVITDTFHGAIFSIINRRPMAVLVRPSTTHRYGNEEKLGFLLELLGLSSQRVATSAELAAVVDQPIDYEAVAALLDRQRERTSTYLCRHVGAPVERT